MTSGPAADGGQLGRLVDHRRQPVRRRADVGGRPQPGHRRRLVAERGGGSRHRRGDQRARLSAVAVGGVPRRLLEAPGTHQQVGEDVLVPRVAGRQRSGEHVDQLADRRVVEGSGKDGRPSLGGRRRVGEHPPGLAPRRRRAAPPRRRRTATRRDGPARRTGSATASRAAAPGTRRTRASRTSRAKTMAVAIVTTTLP